jgi:HK97 family phage portal protein
MNFGQRVKEAYKILKGVPPEDPGNNQLPESDERGTYSMPVTEYNKSESVLAGLNVASGVNVNSTTAMKLGVVFACVRLLSEQISSFGITVKRKTGSTIEDLTGGSIYQLLHYPNKFMNRFSFMELMNARLQLYGNAFAVIMFDNSGNPIELIPVDSNSVTVKFYQGEPFYLIRDTNMGIDGMYYYWQVIHFKMLSRNGVTGLSPISAAREGIGLGLAAERFGADFFAKGGNMKGTIETEGHIPDKEFKAWKNRWDKYYGGSVGDHTTPILEYGMKYKPIGIPPNDAQVIETRQFQVQDICRFFLVPPPLIGDLSRATFSNGEQQDLQFVKYSLRPTVKREEVELEYKLVSRREAGTIDINFNLDSLLRADTGTRADYEVKLVQAGIITRNEAREIENKAPLPGLDVPLDPAFLTGKKAPAKKQTNPNQE